MPYYKDLSNKLHAPDAYGFEHLLPAGSIEITQEEYDILANPPPTAEQVKATRTAQIKAALAELDAKSIRPLRDGDTARLSELEAQANALRKELGSL